MLLRSSFPPESHVHKLVLLLTNQGTPFVSRLLFDLGRLSQVRQLRTLVYHLQNNSLVERSSFLFAPPIRYPFASRFLPGAPVSSWRLKIVLT